MKHLWPVLAAAACATPAPPPLMPQVAAPQLAKGSMRSELVLACVPTDAEVLIDGVPQGTCRDYDGSPKALQLGRSSTVVVKKDGFLPWEAWVAADGTRVVMKVKLEARPKEGGTP